MDTVEKVTGQSDCTFPLWPMTGATLLSNLSNENVGVTIERGGSVSSGNLLSKLVSHAGASITTSAPFSEIKLNRGEHSFLQVSWISPRK